LSLGLLGGILVRPIRERSLQIFWLLWETARSCGALKSP